jgi:hypothetical protein
MAIKKQAGLVSGGTLTTEEWKAEQQLFLGQGEERTNHASRPTHQQAVPVNFLLRAGPPRQGGQAGSDTSANSQVWTTLDSSLAWIATQPLSIVAAPREQC